MTALERSACSYTVCVCTSYAAAAEPRAPRHAVAIACLDPAIQVVFIECLPMGVQSRPVQALDGIPNIRRVACFFPHKTSGLVRLFLTRCHALIARGLYLCFGYLCPAVLPPRGAALGGILAKFPADLYVGHNIEALLPILRAAKSRRVPAIFDCMEFYSDMGNGQTTLERRIIASIEQKCLPACELVLASSDQVADALMLSYGIPKPQPLYNAPPLDSNPLSAGACTDAFTLYWRNSVLGFGERGLDDALVALASLPPAISLHLQGKMPLDRGRALRARITELGLQDRVQIHPPYLPHEAVREAAKHSVGLCLERKGNRNHDVTVSNKIFDYMMAGLPVVASDLPGLRQVVDRAQGGLLYESGSPEDLAKKMFALYRDPVLRRHLAQNARAFALREGNLEHEMDKFTNAVSAVVMSRRGTLRPYGKQ